MIELLESLYKIGRKTLYYDGLEYEDKYSTESALEAIIEKINEIVEHVNNNK